ncbi:MAG: DNA primase [Rhodobacteraceae bacterium]|nr:DNA primase [Paracoccaceae bacterium]
MAFPPAFLDELKTRSPLSDIVGRKVTWDARKSNPSKGDYWACCPFHGEKSPSFHILDREGFYYCFGCHEKGSVFDFVMKTENMSFPETVKMLASLAGMPVPEDDPRAAEREEKRRGLAEAMEAAVRRYRTQLGGARAEEARVYLAKRGLTPETIDRFEIGFAPNVRDGLTQELMEAGFSAATLIEAGLAAAPDPNRRETTPYDRFRDRIMFPIRDPRGRCIGFGGRAMSTGKYAKYLNSPETPLFHKGRTLYNHGPARGAVGSGAPLIVAEGYMDVIALVQAGFEAAVAPLGTALTEDQLAHLWRMADEPVIALDGDSSGLNAAYRAAELALPSLGPGKTLRFALMPADLDPDDVLAKHGRGAMAQLIDGAIPLIELLWRRESASARLDAPERIAAFEEALRALAVRVGHEGVRKNYQFEFNRRRFELLRERNSSRGRGGDNFNRKGGKAGGGRQGRGWNAPPQGPAEETRRLVEAMKAPPSEPPMPEDDNRAPPWEGAAPSEAPWDPSFGDGWTPPAEDLGPILVDAATRRRESVLLTLLLNHPDIVMRRRFEFEETPFVCPQLDSLKYAIISATLAGDSSDKSQLESVLLETVSADFLSDMRTSAEPVLPRAGRPNASIEAAEACFLELSRFHATELTWLMESEEFATALCEGGDEEGDVAQAAEARLQAAHAASAATDLDDEAQIGADDTELSQRLQSFVDAQPWIKRAKRAPGAA